MNVWTAMKSSWVARDLTAASAEVPGGTQVFERRPGGRDFIRIHPGPRDPPLPQAQALRSPSAELKSARADASKPIDAQCSEVETAPKHRQRRS
jgi:hypothetical protein